MYNKPTDKVIHPDLLKHVSSIKFRLFCGHIAMISHFCGNGFSPPARNANGMFFLPKFRFYSS